MRKDWIWIKRDFDFVEFLDKISPLKGANKLGTIIIQLPPSFTIRDFEY